MTAGADPDRLDDEDALQRHDGGAMLRQVATSGAQVREAELAAEEAGLSALAAEGRPRAVVVAGLGGSGIAGDVLAAVCGTGCPVPVLTVRSYTLPGWVGAADLVVAVSCSGSTEETLAVAGEAVRRGCRLVTVGATESPLAGLPGRGGAPHVPVRSVGQPRASLWALSVPLLVLARELGLAEVPDGTLEATAQRLDDLSHRCRPSSESFVNPAKELALELAGSVPLAWGSTPLAGVAAYRFACQLAENAKYPALSGTLPESNHNQVVCFDGTFVPGPSGVEDLFRDRVEEPVGETTLRLLVLRDTEEHPQVARRCEASLSLAGERGVPARTVAAEGEHRLERLASLIGLVDYASVYLALLLGIDPTPVTAIEELKSRIAQ